MSLLKRITLAVSASVDRLVGEIENHDAVVEAGIRERRRLYAKARVRHRRMHEEGERLRQRLERLKTDAEAWRSRALATGDETQALECLRRAKLAAAQAESLGVTLGRHLEVEVRLAQELESLRRRVEDLEHRRTLMRGREATAEAANRIREGELGTALDLDDTFDRWEVRLCESELGPDPIDTRDPFEARLVAEEERAALEAELHALRRGRETRREDGHEA